MSKLRMCPHCRAFVPASERVCTECREPLGRTYRQRVASSVAAFGLVPPTHLTTMIILLINGALFAASLVMSMKKNPEAVWSIDGYVLYSLGAKETMSILAGGQWWRLVTAGFLHGGVVHILMNSWALYDLGAQVEETYGTARLLVFYLGSSVAGFLASTWWTRALSIGASAALFGLIGAMIAYGYRNRTSLGLAMKAHYARWAVYGLLFSLLPGFSIDIAAHVGGLAGGFVLAYVADRPGPRAHDWFWKGAAGVALLVTALSFLIVGLNFRAP